MRAMALVVALVGCAPGSEAGVRRALAGMPEADLTTADPVAWSAASAPRVFSLGVGFAPSWTDHPSPCVEQETSGGVTTWRGVCVDEEGTEWFGEVAQEGDTVRYRGFGYALDTGCEEPAGVAWDGTFVGPDAPSVGEHAFAVTLRITSFGRDGEGCEPVDAVAAVLYEGTVDWSGEEDVREVAVWDGAGDYGADELGRATVETRAEVVDDGVCTSEAASGVTAIRSDGHALDLAYDGEDDCDGEGTVRWTLDGVDQGEVSGVYCSTGPAPGASMLGLALAAALSVRRRRR